MSLAQGDLGCRADFVKLQSHLLNPRFPTLAVESLDRLTDAAVEPMHGFLAFAEPAALRQSR